ncbi:hypothetical protein O983_28180 [Mycobacterium avium 09-5983]|nr:hypothetical protein O983_28180 [Mycobacterium avium 09-5983]
MVCGLRHRRRTLLPGIQPAAQGEKFDPSGDYIRRWVPELRCADDPHLRTGERPPGYPAPIVDHATERAEALRRYRSM